MRVRQRSHSLGVFYIAKKFGGGDRRGLKGRERGVGFLGRGQTAPSPSARGSGGPLYALPAGSGAEPRPPKRFLAFYRR